MLGHASSNALLAHTPTGCPVQGAVARRQAPIRTRRRMRSEFLILQAATVVVGTALMRLWGYEGGMCGCLTSGLEPARLSCPHTRN